MPESDDELIGRYLEGDVRAFEALYARHGAGLMRFLCSLGPDRDLAEDVFQSAWLRAVERLGQYRREGRFKGWLFRIANTIWLDQVRSAWRRKSVPLDDRDDAPDGPLRREYPSALPSPVEVAMTGERRCRVEAALALLPIEMRQTLLLRIDGEMTYREVAEEMNCSLGTALWRAREGTRRLRESLAEKAATEEATDAG